MKKFFLTAMLCMGGASCLAGLGVAPDLPPNNIGFGDYSESGYSRRDTVLETGTRISEFVSNAGKVFAVTWKGPVTPDLKALLGPYFGIFTDEASKQAALGVSQFSVERPEFVVQAKGRLGSFMGRAWIPAELPSGFNTNALN